MSAIFLSCAPFVTIFIAVILRIVSAAQPESSWSDSHRRILDWASYLLTAISVVGMVFLAIVTGNIGIPGFVLIAILAATIIEAEVRIAGSRSRTRQVEFLWILATAVKSKRSLADEIEAYAEGTWGTRYSRLMSMAERIREGVPLTEIVVPQGLLPRAALMPIHAGITSQSLEQALHSTAVRFTRQLVDDQATPHPGSAFIYPAAFFPFMLIVLSYLMFRYIPKYKKIFDDFNTELPPITQFLIWSWEVSFHYWYLLAVPLFYVPLAIFMFVTLAEYHGWQVMSQSMLGRWFVRAYTPDLLRSLSRAVAQRIPMHQALMSLATYAGPLNFRERLAWSAEDIEGGRPEWQSLQKTGFLNSHESILLETAQRAGNLEWMLETLATNMQRRWAFRLVAILEVLHPLLLIGIAFAIGFIAIAMFLPLVKLISGFA